MSASGRAARRAARRTGRRVAAALAAAAALALAAALLLAPAGRELIGSWSVSSVRDALLRMGPWAWLLSTALMVLQALASPLPAFVVTIANGYVFGPFWGGVLALLSATLAAQVCFEVARALGRPILERWLGGAVLEWADGFFERHGVWAVLVARLLPFVPFDPISYAAGLTTTTRARFVAANLVGQVPATFVYSTIGGRLVDGRLPGWVLWLLVGAAGAVIAGWALRSLWRDRKEVA
ncbi:MAG: TVP38/TMEM64 family protein [Planctomycetes bacterium]|nr:TVP38/TMEM64 family protein [Planctomycetota bacterium]